MDILILGGRGFIGSALTRALEKSHTVYTFDRDKGSKQHYRGDILSREDLQRAVHGKDLVINCIGLSPLRKPKGQSYEDVHVNAMKLLLEVMKEEHEHRAVRLIHMSAIHADAKSDIEYFRTKGLAEQSIIDSGIEHTIFRPTVVFDTESELYKQLDAAAEHKFFANITTKVQPITRDDLVLLLEMAVNDKIEEKIITVAGPEKIPFVKLAKKMFTHKGCRMRVVPLWLFKIVFYLGCVLGVKGLSLDQYKSLRFDMSVKENDAKKYISLGTIDYLFK